MEEESQQENSGKIDEMQNESVDGAGNQRRSSTGDKQS